MKKVFTLKDLLDSFDVETYYETRKPFTTSRILELHDTRKNPSFQQRPKIYIPQKLRFLPTGALVKKTKSRESRIENYFAKMALVNANANKVEFEMQKGTTYLIEGLISDEVSENTWRLIRLALYKDKTIRLGNIKLLISKS